MVADLIKATNKCNDGVFLDKNSFNERDNRRESPPSP